MVPISTLVDPLAGQGGHADRTVRTGGEGRGLAGRKLKIITVQHRSRCWGGAFYVDRE